MAIEIKEKLPATGDIHTVEGDILPSYTGDNGPRNSSGALIEELEAFDDDPFEYRGEVPAEFMPFDSNEYKIWAATEKARQRAIQESAGAIAVDVAELPSDDNRALYAPFDPTGQIPVPRRGRRGSNRRPTIPEAKRNARIAEAEARRHRRGK